MQLHNDCTKKADPLRICFLILSRIESGRNVEPVLGGLNVFGAASFRALAFFELDGIAFAKVFEISDYRCAVEEQIIASGSDEAEAFVCDDFLNGSLGHVY